MHIVAAPFCMRKVSALSFRQAVVRYVRRFVFASPSAEDMYDAQKTVDNTRTMGVALTPCIVPEAGKATFSIGDDEMEIGMGIHGEPGIECTKLETMLARILEDLPFASGDMVAVLVNGLGATPKEELYIAYRKAAAVLREKGISVHRNYIGEYATSLEMAGMSISLLRLDDELKELIDAPCRSPFFEQSK